MPTNPLHRLTPVISLLRGIVTILVIGVSSFAVLIGWIGRITLFSSLPSKLLFLIISPSEAQEIRDDVSEELEEAAEVAINEYGKEGYPNRQSKRHIEKQAEDSIPDNRQLFETGEFGFSVVLTGVAILSAFFGVGGLVSIGLAVITGVLVLSVAMRVALINHLAYTEIPEASFSKVMTVWLWNKKVLGEGFVLLYLLVFRYAKSTYEPFYEECLSALAEATAKSIQHPGSGMMLLFWKEIRMPFTQMAKELYNEEDHTEDVSTAEA